MADSDGLKEAGRVHCSDPSSRIGLCSHTPGAQVVADIHGARLVHGGGAMVVDAVMSMVGVGLGDAVVEAVLPGGEAMNAGGHAMEAHA